jgi:uncharacterized protein
MPTVTSHAPGSFCWIELATSDAAAARSFYTELFGWSVREDTMGEAGTYYLFQKSGRDVGAMYQPAPGTMPPNWMSYIAVAGADAAAQQAATLGGTVVMGPFDVGDLGRMAVLTDPQGGSFSIWEARKNPGVGMRDEVGTLCWNELQVREPVVARTFYAPLFGWRLKESPGYTEFHLGEHAVGGMIQSQAPPEVPSYWMPYFSVADCDVTAQRAEELGAAVHVPPTDIEHVGRFAVLADPLGASFALIRLAM